MLEAGDRRCAKDDPECAAIVLEQLAREGVVIRSGVKVTRVGQNDGRIQAVIETRARRGDHRRIKSFDRRGPPAELEGLDLEAPASNTSHAASWSTGA